MDGPAKTDRATERRARGMGYLPAPRIPRVALGLLRAVECSRNGDHSLIEVWMRRPAAALQQALEHQRWAPWFAEECTTAIIERLILQGTPPVPVECEASWLSACLHRMYLDEIRRVRRRRTESLTGDEPITADIADPGVFQSLTRAAKRLPPPYRQICHLQYIRGATRQEVLAYLRSWRPVSPEQARWLLREAHRMLRLILNGEDPKARWPRRYKCTPWILTPPPPVARLHLHRS